MIMVKNETDTLMISTLEKVKGIIKAYSFATEDRRKILEIEEDAEKRSLMGLGKVINVGVREVLKCDLVYVALIVMTLITLLSGLDYFWRNRSILRGGSS